MKTRAGLAILLLASLLALSVQVHGETQDYPTNGQRAFQYLSRTYDIPLEDLTLVSGNIKTYPLTGQQLWHGTILDTATNRVYAVAINSRGDVVDAEQYRQAEISAYRARYGKLSPSLYDLLETKEDTENVKVGIWLRSNGTEAADAVAASYPEARLLGQRPGRDTDMELYREIEEKMAVARQQAYAASELPIVGLVQSRGFEVTFAAKSAPLVFAEIPRALVLEIGQRPDVDTIYRSLTYRPALDVSGPAVGAPVSWDAGFTGTGVRVAVIEAGGVAPDGGKVDFDHLSIPNAELEPPPPGRTNYYDPGDPKKGNHATAVAGIITSTDHQGQGRLGVSHGIRPLLNGNAPGWDDAGLIAATEWAINQGPIRFGDENDPDYRIGSDNAAQVLNLSFAADASGQMELLDRYYDHVVDAYSKTVVVAAGNQSYSPDSYVTSPGLSYNAITVGAYDDRNTVLWTDDIMWDGSCYVDPVGTQRQKPEVGAPGVGITTTHPVYTWREAVPGTSVAAPHVSGAAALLMDQDESEYGLRVWPMAVKAIIMASAIHNIEGDNRLSDKDGAGGIVTWLANEIVSKGQFVKDYLTSSSFDGEGYKYYYFNAVKGQQVRVAISWDSHPADTSPYEPDPLKSDLNLWVYDHDDQLILDGGWSDSADDNYEIADFVAPKTGQYEVRVHKNRWDHQIGSGEYIGVAWANLFRGDWADSATSQPTGWNLFSFPLEPHISDWSLQLGDDIQPLYVYWYDPTPPAGYDIAYGSPYDPFFPELGKGYWTKVNNPTTVDAAGYLAPEQDFRIHLLPGWNMIGDPFDFNVYWADVQVDYGGSVVDILTSHGNNWVFKYLYWYDPMPPAGYEIAEAPAGVLLPWIGYWVRSFVEADLIIPYMPYGGGGMGAGSSMAGGTLLDGGTTLWSAQLSAQSGSLGDAENFAFVATDASEQYDTNDVPEPPTPPQPFLRLYFPHPDWPENPGEYAGDARPEAGGITWDFEVQATFVGQVTLTWDVSQVPPEYTTVELRDGNTNDVLVPDMRTTSQYQYTPPYPWMPIPFKFVVGGAS